MKAFIGFYSKRKRLKPWLLSVLDGFFLFLIINSEISYWGKRNSTRIIHSYQFIL